MKENRNLYVSIAALNYLLGSTWILALYNEPGMLKSKTLAEWVVIGIITLLFTGQNALIAWKAWKSNPLAVAGEPPAPVPPIQKPAGTTTDTTTP